MIEILEEWEMCPLKVLEFLFKTGYEPCDQVIPVILVIPVIPVTPCHPSHPPVLVILVIIIPVIPVISVTQVILVSHSFQLP